MHNFLVQATKGKHKNILTDGGSLLMFHNIRDWTVVTGECDDLGGTVIITVK
jgi:hypothetical protein